MKFDKDSLLLYAVTDRHWLKGRSLKEDVESALKGGASFIQLREKEDMALEHDAYLQEALEIGRLCRSYGVPFVLDDEVELAIEADADGVHVGQEDMEAGMVREKLGKEKILGVSVQTVEEEKKGWTVKGDPRVTWIGKIIRKTSIDELPQFFNVLRGDMSLIGPRPERTQFVEQFKEQIPRYMIKHQVRPGMTGWAQVNGFRGDTSIEGRIRCDLWYIENWSLSLDIRILFLTLWKGFINKNAY